MRRFGFVFPVGLALALLLVVPAPAPPQESPSDEELAVPTFRTGTASVMVDMVVRDKDGRSVVDLKPEELEVKEDGVRCQIQSFRLLDGAAVTELIAGAVAPAAAPAAEGEPARVLNLITLVFDRMRVESTQFARRAALDFLERAATPDARIAVFKLGIGLGILHGYSGDAAELRTAVEMATTVGDTVMDSMHAAAMASLERAQRSYVTGDNLGQAAAGLDYSTMQMNRIEASALRFADQLERQVGGSWSLYPLLALLKAQERLPGRKTIVFFSEGMLVADQLTQVFESAIGQANSANVSIYAIDVRGLSSGSDTQAGRDALNAAAATSRSQLMKGGGDAVTRDEVMTTDTALESLRMNPQQTLRDLSEKTGGFLIANANDVGPSLGRLTSDIQTHYELAYVSPQPSFDGKLRRIEVKVRRKGVDVQTRNGYFAMPPGLGVIVAGEVPLLTALSDPNPRHDFEHRADAFRFGAGPLGYEHVLMVDVPLAGFEFGVDKKKKTYELRLSLMAMVTDQDGQVIGRVSDEYPLSGPLDQLEQVKTSSAVLRRPAYLPPGRFTLETVAVQRGEDKKETPVLKASVGRRVLEVPPLPPAGPALGEVCLIERAFQLPPGSEAPAGDPFVVDNLRIVPAMTHRVAKSQTPALSLFAMAYPVEGKGESSLTLELLREGELLGRAPAQLPAADAQGRVPFVTSLPTDGMAEGRYAVRLILEQAGAKGTSETPFELVP
jgi:VWFA-related protein